MKKSVWMSQLERSLSREGLSGSEKRTVLNYYEEMYQDKREDGMTEEEILREFGFPEDVAQNVRENEYRERGEYRNRRDERRYDRNGYGGYADNGYNPFDDEPPRRSEQYGNGYSQTPPPPPPQYQQPSQSAPKKESRGFGSSIVEILTTLLKFALVVALIFAGIGIAIGGGSCIIGSFFAISESIGGFLAALGVGIVLLAVGCLLFAAGLKLAKTYAPNGGAK